MSLGFWRAPWTASGRIRRDAYRVNALDDPGVSTLPDRFGIAAFPAEQGERGEVRQNHDTWQLRYGWTPAGWRLGALFSQNRSASREIPDAGADAVNYSDLRRTQIYQLQSYYGIAHYGSPSQYHFGGLGLYDDDTAERERLVMFNAEHDIQWGSVRHLLSGGAGVRELTMRENQLRSGARGDNGPLVGLYVGFGGIILPDSMIRLRRGFTAQVVCPRPDPTAPDLVSACQSVQYQINAADLSPAMRDDRLRDERAFLGDAMFYRDWRLDSEVRWDRVTIGSPNRYSLHSDATGSLLQGSDGWTVGSRVEDVRYDPNNPPPYTEAPGVFVAGHYRFPGALSGRLALSWNAQPDAATKPATDTAAKSRLSLFASLARDSDLPSPDLAMHAFENEFGIAALAFAFPDLTQQSGPAATFGGGTALIAPDTRLGYTDRFAVGGEWRPAPAFSLSAKLSLGRLGRAVDHTQANYAEAVANRAYDVYLASDAQFGTRYCLNCARGQLSLFSGYIPGVLNGDVNSPNPDSRSFLSETLSNPGENTAPGRFPRPERRETALDLSLSWKPGLGPLSLTGAARWLRVRGNYAGPVEVGNGLRRDELTSIYEYPASPLVRSFYQRGDLTTESPLRTELTLAYAAPAIRGLDGALRWRRAEGTPRTAWLSPPGKQTGAILPGDTPDYYILDLDQDGRPDRFVLRDYRPLSRGALGRNPARNSLDALLRYHWRGLGGEMAAVAELDNLLNSRRALRYDDRIELPLGYVASAASLDGLAPRLPMHEEPPSDPTILGSNPAYGLPLATQAPRRLVLALSWIR